MLHFSYGHIEAQVGKWNIENTLTLFNGTRQNLGQHFTLH